MFFRSLLPLPTPLHGNGPRIILERYSYSPINYNVEEFIQMMGALHEVLAYDDPYAGVCGLVYVMDFTTVHRDHLSGFTATLLKFLTSLKEKALPMRLRAIYFINLKPFVEQLLKIGLSVMPTSLKKKVSGELFSKNPQILTIFFLIFRYLFVAKISVHCPKVYP